MTCILVNYSNLRQDAKHFTVSYCDYIYAQYSIQGHEIETLYILCWIMPGLILYYFFVSNRYLNPDPL